MEINRERRFFPGETARVEITVTLQERREKLFVNFFFSFRFIYFFIAIYVLMIFSIAGPLAFTFYDFSRLT